MATSISENAAHIPKSPIKNLCEWCGPPMEAVTAFTQLRTDTTLDLSQKAEKVCRICFLNVYICYIFIIYGSPSSY